MLHEYESEFDTKSGKVMHETTSEFAQVMHEIRSETAGNLHESKSEVTYMIEEGPKTHFKGSLRCFVEKDGCFVDYLISKTHVSAILFACDGIFDVMVFVLGETVVVLRSTSVRLASPTR